MGLNVEGSCLEVASCFLHCSIGNAPFKFIRLPIVAKPWREETWRPIVNMMKRRLVSWKYKHISPGGRIVLINSVLSKLPLYFSLFPQGSKEGSQNLGWDSDIFQFGKDDSHKVAWVKWSTICRPKSKGGLGIKNSGFI